MIKVAPLSNIGRRTHRRSRLGVDVLEDRLVPTYFPPTTTGIHVFEDQLPSMSNAVMQFVATHTDGTQKQTSSAINQLRAINPNYTLLHYQLGTGNSPYDYIIGGQWSSDWDYVNQQESWFAHQSYSDEPQSASDLSSGRVGNSTGWDQADIANPDWQQYTLNQVLQNMAATGANGWFADSFTFGIGGAGYDGTIPIRYQGTNAANPAYWPGGITWTDQFANWAQAIETAFAQQNATYGTDYQFIPNLDAQVTSWVPDWYDNANGVPIVDGAFLEGFGEYTDTYDWTLSMNRGLNLTTNDKIAIMQPYLQDTPDSATGQQERNFYLGTYLLLKGDETYLNIMDSDGGAQYYPEYQLNLGTATTPLPSNVSSYLWNGVYRRDFQNGFVLVNPGSTTDTLNLGGNYQEVQAYGGGILTDADLDANGNYIGGTLTYQNVSSVTLAGGSAAIFLSSPSAPPSITNVVINQDIPSLNSGPTGSVQRSTVDDIVYTFSEPVNIASPSVDPNVFTVAVASGWTGTAPTTLEWAPVAGSNDTQWEVDFGGGSIANGAYTITITDPESITAQSDSQVLSLDSGGIGGATQSFYRLFGDINGDEIVNAADNVRLKQALATYNAAFDYNGDSYINAFDNAQFKQDLSVNFSGFAPTI